MNQPPEYVQRLYCIAEYPVKYRIDFDGIFKRFDGFSDHTLGISQSIEAVNRGARIIEKHFRLDNKKCDHVPDGMFAIKPYLLEKLCTVAKCQK
jgi:sialic acid synthase SpsE